MFNTKNCILFTPCVYVRVLYVFYKKSIYFGVSAILECHTKERAI